MNKIKLLPHKFQIIGICALLLTAILGVALVVASIYGKSESGLTIENILELIFWISALLCIFSREKNEDEITDLSRRKATAITILFVFAVIIIYTVIRFFNLSLSIPFGQIILPAVLLYLILLKIFNADRKAKN